MQEGDEAPCFHFCKSLRLEEKDTARISFSCGPAFEVSLSFVIPETHQQWKMKQWNYFEKATPDFNISITNMWNMQNKGPAMHSCDITHCVQDCPLLGAKKKKCNWTDKSGKGIAKIFKGGIYHFNSKDMITLCECEQANWSDGTVVRSKKTAIKRRLKLKKSSERVEQWRDFFDGRSMVLPVKWQRLFWLCFLIWNWIGQCS